MSTPAIAYAGMTHLGINSAVASAERGFETVCFDSDGDLIARLAGGDPPVVEPDLPRMMARNKDHLRFTDRVEDLIACDVVYAAPDVATDDQGRSDLSDLGALLDLIEPAIRADAVEVVLSQVPPGFTRGRQRPGRVLYYQVETLIFGQAVARALDPERIIVGCADPGTALPKGYRAYLEAFGCPVLTMGYESAEMAKIAINCCLVAQISVANTLAELCENIGADWAEIAPALRSDRRIGPDAYLKPGLGIAGGNLERDLATVIRLAGEQGTDAGVVQAWVANSAHRKLAAARILKERVLGGLSDPVIAVWGLAYKAGADSTRNAPSLATIEALPEIAFRVHDPVVDAGALAMANAVAAPDPLAAAEGADALLILTPWPAYGDVAAADVAKAMRGRTVVDPFGVLDRDDALAAGLDYLTLGAPPAAAD